MVGTKVDGTEVRPFTMKFLEGEVLEENVLRAIPKLLPLKGGLLYTSFGGVVLELTTLTVLCLYLIYNG